MTARRMVVGAASMAVLVFAMSASASSSTAWNAKSMAAAAKALHYPEPALKMTCRGKTSFRCVASLKHHRRKIFYARWQGGGGWICAGSKPSSCKLLRRGFAPNRIAAGDPRAVAEAAAVGVMANKHGTPTPYIAPDCPTLTPPQYAFCYQPGIQVTITLKKAKTGYIITATSRQQ